MSKNNEKYKTIISSITEALENSGRLWEKPWLTVPPHNGISGRMYNGVNILSLWLASAVGEYTSNSWFTFNQAKKIGGSVRKGERGHKIGFFEIREYETEGDAENKKIPLHKVYTLFNEEQIDWGDENPKFKVPKGDFEKIEAMTPEDKLEFAWKFFESLQVDYRIFGERACYDYMKDEIRMPSSERFKSDDYFYATLFHEVTHWTGHSSRLERIDQNTFKRSEYAFEELVAEFGSAILCAFLGIEGQIQHVEYISSWLKFCKDEPNTVIKAASKAQAAVDYCLKKAAKNGCVLFEG